MKKTLLILALLLAATAAKAQYHYDANNDGVVNGTDITLIAGYILSGGTDAATQAGLCPDANHPHQIDMGAAGKWSCCNMGATSPVQYGNYYAWGETETKTSFKLDNYAHYHNDAFDNLGDISGNKAYDVTAVKWAGTWQMPTEACLKSLMYNCINEQTTIDGVKGILFTATNGNRIFLPAAGYYLSDNSYGEGSFTGIWASTPDPSNNSYAIGLAFNNGSSAINGGLRAIGLSVRPVAEYKAPDIDNATTAGLCPDANHPHIIDMGEAGKWACCNVGAEWPFDNGSYFAWGETETKANYAKTTYAHYNNGAYDNLGDISGNAQYDAATANWGSMWKMPTKERNQLLISKCTYEWTTLNRIQGGLFTAPNGNKLFFPAAGQRIGTSLYNNGSNGLYWSSNPYSSDGEDTSLTRAAMPARVSPEPSPIGTGESYYLSVYSNNAISSYSTYSYYGLPVRPVVQ